MTFFEAIVLGVVQGLTEFLPVSSSGHLVLFPVFFGWNVQSIVFDVAVHVATLGAIFVALWPRISQLLRGLLARDARYVYLAGLLLLATIPAGVFGVFFGDWLELQRTPPLIASMLIFWGVLLYFADVYSEKVVRTVTHEGSVPLLSALAIGIAQAIALFPGTSRSGVSMSTALFLGFDRKTAAQFSFLLAIPAIAGAGFVTALDVVESGLDISLPVLLVGCVSAFLTGIAAIRFLFAVIDRGGFRWFALYRIALGVVVFVLWSVQA